MKKRRTLYPCLEWSRGSLVAISIACSLIAFAGCGGGGDEGIGPEELDAVSEIDTGYDATEILERLTNRETYDDPESLAALAADFNAVKDSMDFHTAKRQVKDLSVDFRNRPMRASMAAAIMDKWNKKPPADLTAADLEQAWAIRRIAKKTEEELARERALQLEDRQNRQSQVDAQRAAEVEKREQSKVDTIGLWIESYEAATVEGRSALGRVHAALTDPSRQDDLGAACKDLFQATQDMDGGIFRAPDPGIAAPLGKAWERFRTASRSCMKGELAYLTHQLDEGLASMKEVNAILGKYGKSL